MNVKYFFKKIIDRLYAEYVFARLDYLTRKVYYQREAIGHLKDAPLGDYCELAVVAFNNFRVIEYQIRTLSRFFLYPYRYSVFDNSTTEEYANRIRETCHRYEVGYIRLPLQEFLPQGKGSYSHGIACNFLYNKYFKNSGSKYFGLLDHDIFPVEPFDISLYLEKQFFYGAKHRFYIWPGFWFMRMDYMKGKKVDFRPSLHLRGDTGASNALSLFKDVDFSQYMLVDDRHCCFDGHDDIFEWGYSYFDCGWIHCWNASNYMNKEHTSEKMDLIYQMLEEKLKEDS